MSEYGREPPFPPTFERQWDQGARRSPSARMPPLLPAPEVEAVALLTNPSAPRPLSAIVEEHIRATLVFVGGNRAAAAQVLGIGRRTLYRKLASYGIEGKRNRK